MDVPTLAEVHQRVMREGSEVLRDLVLGDRVPPHNVVIRLITSQGGRARGVVDVEMQFRELDCERRRLSSQKLSEFVGLVGTERLDLEDDVANLGWVEDHHARSLREKVKNCHDLRGVFEKSQRFSSLAKILRHCSG